MNSLYESYKKELIRLTYAFDLTDDLKFLPLMNSLIIKIAIEEDAFNLLTQLDEDEK